MEQDGFSVHLIPETLRVTVLGKRQVGDAVNIEIDSQTQVERVQVFIATVFDLCEIMTKLCVQSCSSLLQLPPCAGRRGHRRGAAATLPMEEATADGSSK